MLNWVGHKALTELRAGEGTIAVDVDLEGLWQQGDYEALKTCFPKAYKAYQDVCLNRRDVGKCVIVEEDGYRLALLVCKKRRRESKETATLNWTNAVADMFTKVPKNEPIYSWEFGKYGHTGTYGNYILSVNRIMMSETGGDQSTTRTWYVYKKSNT